MRILEGRDHLGLCRWAQCNHEGAYKREAEGDFTTHRREQAVCRSQQREIFEDATLQVLKTEKRTLSQGMLGKQLRKLEKEGNSSPLEPLVGA